MQAQVFGNTADTVAIRLYKDAGERWRQGIDALGLTAAEVARRLCVIHGREISRQSVDQIIQGISPGHVHVAHVAKMLETTVEFLANGTGEGPSWAHPERAAKATPIPAADAAAIFAELREIRAEIAALRAERQASPADQTGSVERDLATLPK